MKNVPFWSGTMSIENSEFLSQKLRKRVKHVVLNAKYHEQEAAIIAQAGRNGSVTIATNMAGRGTDILLGGNPEVIARETLRRTGLDPAKAPTRICRKSLGGAKSRPRRRACAHRRHGRACIFSGPSVMRPGGSTISCAAVPDDKAIPDRPASTSRLEDDLMKIFGSDRIRGIAGPSRHGRTASRSNTPWFPGPSRMPRSRSKARISPIRKHLLEYDDVMNKQRQLIYWLRRDILFGKDFKDYIQKLVGELYDEMFSFHIDEEQDSDQWDFEAFQKETHSAIRPRHPAGDPRGLPRYSRPC